MAVWAVQGYPVFMYNRRITFSDPNDPRPIPWWYGLSRATQCSCITDVYITFSDSDDPRPIPWRYGLSRATQCYCITEVSRLVTLMTHDPYHGGMGCPGLLSVHV